MSLKSLETVGSKEAEGVLSTTLLGLSGPGLQFVPQSYKKLSTALITEVRKILNLADEDNSQKAIRAIRDFLSNEIDRQLFVDVDREELRSELGHSGELPITAYKLTFSDQFFKMFKEDKRFIQRSIEHADKVQHLTGDLGEGRRAERGTTLISKKILSTDRKREHILLAQAVRTDDGLDVKRAWRVFPEAVELQRTDEPLDILRAFTDHYGFEVEYTGFRRDRLITDLELPKDVRGPDDTQSLIIVHSDGRDYVATEIGAALTKVTKSGDIPQKTVIILAYAIDFGKYSADLTLFG